MPKKRTPQANTTRRVSGGVWVRPPVKSSPTGGKGRQRIFEELKREWLSDETDLQMLAACEIPKSIPTLPKKAKNEEKRMQAKNRELAEKQVRAAVMWEALRYLYFTNQLSPFWRCWIDKGLVTSLRQFQCEKKSGNFSPGRSLLGRYLSDEQFPKAAFVQLNDRGQKMLALRTAEGAAVDAVTASTPNLFKWRDWISQQIKTSEQVTSALFSRYMMQRPVGSPNRSQIILEIDWSRGFEDIQKGMVEAISAEWKKAHPTGRKARRESDDKFLKGLVVMRRRELLQLPWPDACSVDGYNHNPIYAPKGTESGPAGPSAARESIRQVKAWLKSLLAEMKDDEERLRNTDQTEWLEEYESTVMKRSCRE
jgi:hypothetical protein